jgi:hypothetical protein
MIARWGLVAVLAAMISGCQQVGPVHIGEINQGRAMVLARAELGRRHMEGFAAWRAEVADYATVWVVTYYRPASQADGPPFVRVSLNKHTQKVIAVTSGE